MLHGLSEELYSSCRLVPVEVGRVGLTSVHLRSHCAHNIRVARCYYTEVSLSILWCTGVCSTDMGSNTFECIIYIYNYTYFQVIPNTNTLEAKYF